MSKMPPKAYLLLEKRGQISLLGGKLGQSSSLFSTVFFLLYVQIISSLFSAYIPICLHCFIISSSSFAAACVHYGGYQASFSILYLG